MENELNLDTILKAIEIIVGTVTVIARDKPYGVVKERSPVSIDGTNGWIVWDYIIWNELTFEYSEGSDTKKVSFFTSISDKETKEKLDELKAKYGR